MKQLCFALSLLIFLSLLQGCKELSGGDTGANFLEEMQFIGGVGALELGSKQYVLEGVASNGGNSGHAYKLSLKITEELKFSFFSSRSLLGGVDLRFFKSEGKAFMELSLNGHVDRKELALQDDGETVHLDIDIHNDHVDTHILVWYSGDEYPDEEGCTFDESCLYNSADFSFNDEVWFGVGKASGVYWGFQGNKEQVLKLLGPLKANSNA
jgi:hypothetical protein